MHSLILNKGIISHPYLNTVEALVYGGDNLNKLKEWVLFLFFIIYKYAHFNIILIIFLIYQGSQYLFFWKIDMKNYIYYFINQNLDNLNQFKFG